MFFIFLVSLLLQGTIEADFLFKFIMASVVSCTFDQVVKTITERIVAPVHRWNPYSFEDAVDFTGCGGFGARMYSSTVGAPVPFEGPTATIVVGCVPHGMKADRLRWVVSHVTGVTPLAVRDGRRNLRGGRVPSGVYFIKVRAEDALTVLAFSGCALCCQECLWLPTKEAAEHFRSVAALLKQNGLVRTNPLRFERKNDAGIDVTQ